MEGVVTADFRVCPASPLVIHLQKGLVLATQHKVNYREVEVREGRGAGWSQTNHGGSSSQTSSSPVVEIISSSSAIEWELHMCMGVYTTWRERGGADTMGTSGLAWTLTWHDQLPCGIHHSSSTGYVFQVTSHLPGQNRESK